MAADPAAATETARYLSRAADDKERAPHPIKLSRLPLAVKQPKGLPYSLFARDWFFRLL
jgi:hypothetical protein